MIHDWRPLITTTTDEGRTVKHRCSTCGAIRTKREIFAPKFSDARRLGEKGESRMFTTPDDPRPRGQSPECRVTRKRPQPEPKTQRS